MSKLNVLAVALVAAAWLALGAIAAFAAPASATSTAGGTLSTSTTRTPNGGEMLTPPTIEGQDKTDCTSRQVTTSNDTSGAKSASTRTVCNNR